MSFSQEPDYFNGASYRLYQCSIITQCIKDYPGFGVIPPEYLGMDKKLFGFIKNELRKRSILIRLSLDKH
jgi:hypothetical protein